MGKNTRKRRKTASGTPGTLVKRMVTDKGTAKRRKAVSGTSATQVKVSADTLPRRTLEKAAALADALHTTYAGKSASVGELAGVLGLSKDAATFKYLLWSALAYGILLKEGKQKVTLTEVGRKIVAPTYSQEDREARIKAILTPSLLSRFYSDYNGHPVPAEAHFPNVVETKYGVPRDRVQEAIVLILDNARFAGIIEQPEGAPPVIRISGASITIPEGVGASTHPMPHLEPESAATEEWGGICFYITPIGEDGTDQRKHADMLLKHLVEPAAAAVKLKVVRADRIGKAGLINQQVFEHLARSRICIADLSFGNPNAFYELGVRHMCLLPTVQVIKKGDKIPFDVAQGRTIVVDTTDIYTVMDRIESARKELEEHLRHIMETRTPGPAEDNPVSVYLPGIKVTLPS